MEARYEGDAEELLAVKTGTLFTGKERGASYLVNDSEVDGRSEPAGWARNRAREVEGYLLPLYEPSRRPKGRLYWVWGGSNPSREPSQGRTGAVPE